MISTPLGKGLGVGERVVGEVGLPGLVRHRRLEPEVGRLRLLLRLRVMAPWRVRIRWMAARDSVVARCRGNANSACRRRRRERPRGAACAGAARARPSPVGSRPVRSWCTGDPGWKAASPPCQVAGHEPADGSFGQAVGAGSLGLGQPLLGDGCDDRPRSHKGAHHRPGACRCRGTCLADVLNQYTLLQTVSPTNLSTPYRHNRRPSLKTRGRPRGPAILVPLTGIRARRGGDVAVAISVR